MNARMFSITILASLAVLTLASSAGAECAWALWRFFPTNGKADGSWGTPEAFTSAKECAEGLTKAHGTHKWLAKGENGHRVVETMYSPYRGDITMIFDASGKVYRVESHCLPDTIDPRGPRGK